MRLPVLETEKKVVEQVGKLRSEGLSFEAISDRLNGQGLTTSWDTKWTRVTLRSLWLRNFEPESILERIDSADGMLQLSLRCLEIAAQTGTGQKAVDAGNALFLYHESRDAGLSVAASCAMARRCILEDRKRRQEGK